MQNISVLPLHNGRAPKWLFPRMVKLARAISGAIISEYGENELISRLASPYWFQALACAIGYDWHSSGATTVTVGALKEALNYNSNIFVAGGKGRQGTSTPEQIDKGLEYLSGGSKSDEYKGYSRIIAKIDSSLVYDNIGIYHHSFIFSKSGGWCIVQQAMQRDSPNAIRFQASSMRFDKSDPTNETNDSVFTKERKNPLDLTFRLNEEAKKSSLALVNDDINEIINFNPHVYELPARHEILENVDMSKRAVSLLKYANEMQPEKYEQLLGMKGIGRKTLKSLALLSTLVYGEKVYYRDPILYSYNVGGKDGIPYEINLMEYDRVIGSMESLLKDSDLEQHESQNALKRLSREMETHYSISGGVPVQKNA